MCAMNMRLGRPGHVHRPEKTVREDVVDLETCCTHVRETSRTRAEVAAASSAPSRVLITGDVLPRNDVDVVQRNPDSARDHNGRID